MTVKIKTTQRDTEVNVITGYLKNQNKAFSLRIFKTEYY